LKKAYFTEISNETPAKALQEFYNESKRKVAVNGTGFTDMQQFCIYWFVIEPPVVYPKKIKPFQRNCLELQCITLE
jgi:hypothetical protein